MVLQAELIGVVSKSYGNHALSDPVRMRRAWSTTIARSATRFAQLTEEG